MRRSLVIGKVVWISDVCWLFFMKFYRLRKMFFCWVGLNYFGYRLVYVLDSFLLCKKRNNIITIQIKINLTKIKKIFPSPHPPPSLQNRLHKFMIPARPLTNWTFRNLSLSLPNNLITSLTHHHMSTYLIHHTTIHIITKFTLFLVIIWSLGSIVITFCF